MHPHIVSLKSFDKSLSHAIRLRTVIRRCANIESHGSGKSSCLMGDISRSVVTQLLNEGRNLIHDPKTIFNGFRHEISYDVSVDSSCSGNVTENFPVGTVHREGHPNSLPIPAGNLKYIRAPSPVAPQSDNSAFMEMRRPCCVLLE